MFTGFYLFLCCFFLCLSGFVSPALRRAGIRPWVGSVLCLCAAFLSLLEDIALGPIFFVNPGGFLVPMVGCVLLLFRCSAPDNLWALGFAAIAGTAGYLLTVLCSELVSLVTAESAYVRGFITVLLSCLFCSNTPSALLSSLLGFYVSGALASLDSVLTGIASYAALGSGAECTVVACITPTVLLLREAGSRLYRKCSVLLSKRRAAEPSELEAG